MAVKIISDTTAHDVLRITCAEQRAQWYHNKTNKISYITITESSYMFKISFIFCGGYP